MSLSAAPDLRRRPLRERLRSSTHATAQLLAVEVRRLGPAHMLAGLRAMPASRRIALCMALVAVVALYLVANVPFGSAHGTVLPRKLPPGIVLLGLVYGAINSMVAIGLVLVYRAGRYINFAQGSMGAAAVVLGAKLMQLYGLGWIWIALITITVAAALAVICELTLFQLARLFRAPRLIVTVATLGLVQLLAGVQLLFGSIKSDQFFGSLPAPSVPLHIHFSIGIVPFTGDHVLALLVVPLVVLGLSLFLRLSDHGAAVQAAAENADRARLMGISVRRMHTLVWGIAGGLSGLTALLSAPLFGLGSGAQGGPSLFLLALAPAVLAGLANPGQTLAASLALGLVESTVVWNFGAGVLNVTFLAVLVVALLLRRRVVSRTTEGEERSFAVAARVRPFPRELAGLALVRGARLGFRALLLLLAVTLPMGFDLQYQVLAENVVVFVIAGISLVLVTGFSGQVSFGQWAIVGFGALFGGWLVTAAGLDFWSGLGLVAVGGALVATVIGIPALRIRGLFLGAVTLALALACSDYFFADRQHFPFLTVHGSVQRPSIGPLDLGAHPQVPGNELHYYWFCLAVLVLVIWAVKNLRQTRWGRNFQAVRDNERAAAAFGVGVVQTKLLAFAASGMIAAVAGYLFLFSEEQATSQFFPVTTSLLLFSAVVIGGLGSVAGAVIGGLFFEGVQFFVHVQEVQLLTTSLGLLFVLAFLPGGLGSLFFAGRDALLRVVADRCGIVVPSLLADRRVESHMPGAGAAAGLAADEPAPVVLESAS